ncbi:MAG: ADP-glyceromanno-heptose 6-epimerase [Planctomycetia bacterium]
MIVVTGGAGFIGSNVAAALDARGEEFVVVDRLKAGEKWRNIAALNPAAIVDPAELRPWLRRRAGKVRGIVHLGAVSSTTETDVDKIVRNNLTLSQELLAFSLKTGARLVYASSAATYGDGSLGFDDDADPAALARLRPMNPYGWSKHLFDRRVAVVRERHPPSAALVVGLKFFNVYGPHEIHKGPQQSFQGHALRQATADGVVKLFQGEFSRDFVYVGDCVDVMLWLLDHPRVGGLFNVGTGTARRFEDAAEAVFDSLGMPRRIDYAPLPEILRGKYQGFTQARMERLRAAGFSAPFHTVEEGLAKYAAWWKSR